MAPAAMTRSDLIRILNLLQSATYCASPDFENVAEVENSIQELMPHSFFREALYFSDLEKSIERMADELIAREEIFVAQGEAALNSRIEEQFLATIYNSEAEKNYRVAALSAMEARKGKECPDLREVLKELW
jgi:hypothetical protein